MAIGATTGALAADTPVLKAPPPAVEEGWYYSGGFEAGARFFIERPPSGFGRAPAPDNWLTPRTTHSIAKFEEFGEIPRGLYLDWFSLLSGSKDGRYMVNIWGHNVGLNNQEYLGDFYKVGEHYLTLGWNQSPFLKSTSAKTVFGGVGSTYLSVNDALQANLQANLPNATAVGAAGQTARANIEGFINDAAGPLTLGTQRDKATVAYRFTPTAEWDVKVDYSHEQRTGTKPIAISYAWGAASPGRATNVVEAIQPIDDTTQNVSASAQHIGSSPWGKKWITMFKYSGSHYDNALSYLEAENPFCITCNLLAGASRGPNLLRLALPPSNSVNVFEGNSALDMPWQGRLTNTVQYSMLRQNEPFVDTATNGIVGLAPFPATSANGKVDTLLINNVLTTQWSKDVKSTLRYRYYDFDNDTPELLWSNYVQSDSTISSVPGAAPRRNLAVAYTKQNASAEVNWRATKDVTLGAMYGWERWDRTRRDVDVTNEHIGKLYMDVAMSGLFEGGRSRSSIQYSTRRYENYDEVTFVEHPGIVFSENVEQMRKFDMANRDRWKGESFYDIPLGRMLVVTPNLGYRLDNYPTDVLNQLGVSKDRAWNVGVEIGAALSPTVKTMFAYNYEQRRLEMSDCCGSAAGGVIPANIWSSTINQRYHTFLAAVDWKAIPQKLEFKVEYIYAFGNEANDTTPCSSGASGCTGSGTGVITTQFPTERNEFQRFSVLGRYFVDPEIVRQLGWNGEVIAKVRYVYERNHNVNWATDNMTPYIPSADQTSDLTNTGRSIFLAYYNPNYAAQFIAASLAFKW